MDSLLDTLWDQILIYSLKTASLLDTLLTPLHPLGPTVIIFLLAFSMVLLSGFFRATYTTKRHQQLEKEFQYWYGIRQEAANHADREKGKAMAKNIDQAKLNRAYYDYFFEGLMKTLITTWLPLLLMLAYVNNAFNPTALDQVFGSETLFEFHTVKASAVFWYFVSALLSFIGIAMAKYLYKRKSHRGQI